MSISRNPANKPSGQAWLGELQQASKQNTS